MWRWALVVACCAVCLVAAVTTLRAIRERDVCGVIDRNATELRHMIMDSAEESRRFGTIKLGGQVSTFEDRLKQARTQAARIKGCP